ncbi:MAG: DUF3798 domain-containing protein [Deltaproteobacteria bacterium]|nr:DUF3798 domain-containing protein [Deltaproteobacteria bacterium]
MGRLKHPAVLLVLSLVILGGVAGIILHSGNSIYEKTPSKLGLVTGVSNIYDGHDLVIARMEATYGKDRVKVTRYEDFGADREESVINAILRLGNDPEIGAIVVSPAPIGTLAAFTELRKTRPELILMAAEPSDDPGPLCYVADLAINFDFVAQGYLVANAAHNLGARTLIHVTYEGEQMSLPSVRREAVMRQAAIDKGLVYVEVLVPSEPDGAKVSKYVETHYPQWLKLYGQRTLFYGSTPLLAKSIASQVVENGGYYWQGPIPSSAADYSQALGVTLNAEAEDREAELKVLYEAIKSRGLEGHLGITKDFIVYDMFLALSTLAMESLNGNKRPVVEELTPMLDGILEGSYSLTSYVDMVTSRPVPRYLLLMENASIVIPDSAIDPLASIPLKYQQVRPILPLDGQNFHMGILTGDNLQGGDDWAGARKMVSLYGDVKQNGRVWHKTYGDDFINARQEIIGEIEGFASDPLLKVVVVNEAVVGTAEGFAKLKLLRPDILLIATQAHDPEAMLQEADLVLSTNNISRGYLLVYAAKLMNADSFVHISFPRHMARPELSRRRDIMRAAANDLGLKFYELVALDPAEVGEERATQNILANFPGWLSEYGQKTAFFSTNNAHIEPLIWSVTKYGGIFVEADLPSPTLGYPKVFELNPFDYQDRGGDFLMELERKVVRKGGAGRLGTWAYSAGYCSSAGALEFGRMVVNGQADVDDSSAILTALSKFSPGVSWEGSYYTDEFTGKPVRNLFMIYQDTYVFGRGYLGLTDLEVPLKYLVIGTSFEEIDETSINRGTDLLASEDFLNGQVAINMGSKRAY